MLNLSYVAARERKTGKTVFLANASHIHGHGDNAEVAAQYQKFLSGTEGEDLRGKYSHVLYVLDNTVRGHHEFPDPAEIKRKELAEKIADLKRQHGEAKTLEANAKAAADKIKPAVKAREGIEKQIEAAEAEMKKLLPLPPVAKTIPTAAQIKALDDEGLGLLAIELGIEPEFDPATNSLKNREALLAQVLEKAEQSEK